MLIPQTLILFKSLKTLSLKHVMVSGEAVKIFLLNCPLLEELIIGKSVLTSDVEVYGANLVLKHLEVYCCRGEKSLRVSAPNLTRLKFWTGGRFPTKLFLESIPKLVEARFEFDSQRIDVEQNVASALFCLSSQLEILYLSPPKDFLANEFAEMPKLRKLVVLYFAPKTQSLLLVTSLLWASPRLQEFKLMCGDIGNGDAAVQVRRNGESPHLRLKLFEPEVLVGDVSDGYIELVTYISDNCVGLEKIKISLGSLSRSIDQTQAARNYAQQYLQGKLPQHIQLQLS